MRLQLRHRLDGRAKALELEVREVHVQVRGGEVAHQPDGLPRRLREPCPAEATHARVELQVQRNALRKRRLGHGELESRVTRPPDVVLAGRAHDEDARVREGGAERDTLADRRDAEGASALRERDAGHLDRAVAVRVGLDDGPELRAFQQLEQTPHVVPHGGEVDRDLRSQHRARRAAR